MARKKPAHQQLEALLSEPQRREWQAACYEFEARLIECCRATRKTGEPDNQGPVEAVRSLASAVASTVCPSAELNSTSHIDPRLSDKLAGLEARIASIAVAGIKKAGIAQVPRSHIVEVVREALECRRAEVLSEMADALRASSIRMKAFDEDEDAPAERIAVRKRVTKILNGLGPSYRHESESKAAAAFLDAVRGLDIDGALTEVDNVLRKAVGASVRIVFDRTAAAVCKGLDTHADRMIAVDIIASGIMMTTTTNSRRASTVLLFRAAIEERRAYWLVNVDSMREHPSEAAIDHPNEQSGVTIGPAKPLELWKGTSLARGAALKSFRQERGLSQPALAKKADRNRRMIQRYENDGKNMRPGTLVALLEAMGISQGELHSRMATF